jgi:hypothetical protein
MRLPSFHESPSTRMRPNVPALILIAVGVILLLQNLGLWNVSLGRLIATWWPAVLVVLGVSMLFKRSSK